MPVELVEIEPGRWRVQRDRISAPRSDLPMPHIISDIMEPTEFVDGRLYTSKSSLRRVGKDLGLTEVGDQKLKPRQRASSDRRFKEARRQSIKKAVEQFRSR